MKKLVVIITIIAITLCFSSCENLKNKINKQETTKSSTTKMVKLEFPTDKISVNVGDKSELIYVAQNTQKLKWSSSDTSVAIVENGVVTGVSKGKATIFVQSGEKIATCIVKVKEIKTTSYAEQMKKGYIDVLSNYQTNEYDVYYLYDIDNNGVKELIVKSGTCEADYMYHFFTFKNGNEVVALDSIEAGHSMLGIPDDGSIGLINSRAHMGDQSVDKIIIEYNQIYTYNLYVKKYPYDEFNWLESASTYNYSMIENMK